MLSLSEEVVGRRGIEPLQPKAADLQSAELTTCSTYPRDLPARCGWLARSWLTLFSWSRRRDSNPEPAVYKTAALPIELRRRTQGHAHAKTPGLGNDIGWLRAGQAQRPAANRGWLPPGAMRRRPPDSRPVPRSVRWAATPRRPGRRAARRSLRLGRRPSSTPGELEVWTAPAWASRQLHRGPSQRVPHPPPAPPRHRAPDRFPEAARHRRPEAIARRRAERKPRTRGSNLPRPHSVR